VARVEYKSTPGGVLQRRNGDVRPDVLVEHTGTSPVYAEETGGATVPDEDLITSEDGEVPGWLEAGIHTTTDPTTGKSVTFEVGGGSAGSTPDADATTKGKLQLAGDLGGTAAAPTVPGHAARLTSVESGRVRNALADDPINTAQIFQGINGYNPDGTALPGFTATPVLGISTGGIYTEPDTTGSNIFHSAAYAYNNTVGAAPTVAVFGYGKGDRAFGGNFIGYTDGHGIAQGVEIDYGNVGTANSPSVGSQVLPVGTFNVVSTAGAASTGVLLVGGNYGRYTGITGTSFTGVTWEVGGTGTIADGTTTHFSIGGTATGLTIASFGPNIGGSPPGAYLQMQAAVMSAAQHGINFNSSSRPAVISTGILVRATGENCSQGIGLSGSKFSTAAALLPVNSGSTTTTLGLLLQAEGGFANAGAFVDMRASGAGSSVTDGIRFRLSGGVQPITGSLIKVVGAVTATVGIDFATLAATIGIAMGDNNISCGTTTGMKIGTATTQKLGFWNKAPVVQPAAVADASGGATVDTEARTALNALLARLRTTGLIAT
jgi:hypothetical protein